MLRLLATIALLALPCFAQSRAAVFSGTAATYSVSNLTLGDLVAEFRIHGTLSASGGDKYTFDAATVQHCQIQERHVHAAMRLRFRGRRTERGLSRLTSPGARIFACATFASLLMRKCGCTCGTGIVPAPQTASSPSSLAILSSRLVTLSRWEAHRESSWISFASAPMCRTSARIIPAMWRRRRANTSTPEIRQRHVRGHQRDGAYVLHQRRQLRGLA